MVDQGPQHRDHGLALLDRGGAKVDVLVVAGPEGGEGLGRLVGHADLPGARAMVDDQRVDEGAQLLAPAVPAALADQRRERRRV